MHYKMPTYRASKGWIAIAYQKHYVSLYTCSPAHLESFKAHHPGIKTGKGCINLRDTDPFPIDDLAGVIRHAIEQPKGQGSTLATLRPRPVVPHAPTRVELDLATAEQRLFQSGAPALNP